MRFELLGAQLHQLAGLGFGRALRDAAQDLLHHVDLHVAEEQLLLGFLREHLGVVEGDVARQRRPC